MRLGERGGHEVALRRRTNNGRRYYDETAPRRALQSSGIGAFAYNTYTGLEIYFPVEATMASYDALYRTFLKTRMDINRGET